MSALLNWRFWTMLAGTLCALSLVGLSTARLVVEKPRDYHRSSFFEFALPRGWSAVREGQETVCRPPGESRDAMIILAAKYRGSQDTLEIYLEYLSQAKHSTLPDDSILTSKVLHARHGSIGEYQWIDALHEESELPGYRTRYLATVTAQLGIVVTFTGKNELFDHYNHIFEASIESLNIYQAPVR